MDRGQVVNRTDLAALAKKAGNASALRTSLAAYFRTEKGRADLASAPPFYPATGLPRPMTAQDATDLLIEEAQSFLPKRKGKPK